MEKEKLAECIEGRKAMSLYHSFVEAADEMTQDEARDFFYHIVRYGLRGEVPELETKSPLFRIAWKMCLPVLDKDLVKYHNGKHGGAPEGNNNRKGNGADKQTTEVQPSFNRDLTDAIINK
jgi:hypothetical protein